MNRPDPYQHADLLGYLLGALEPDEARQVEQALENHPSLREQLETLRYALPHLGPDAASNPRNPDFPDLDFSDRDFSDRDFPVVDFPDVILPDVEMPDDGEPPAGLAERTAELVFDFADEMEAGGTGHGASAEDDPVDSHALGDSQSGPGTPAKRLSAGRVSPPARELQLSHQRNWSLADVTVAAGVILAAAMIFFPAILSSQYNARKLACQNNLRQIGFALYSYSQQDEQGRFPYVPVMGNRSFAGVQVPVLIDGGYVQDPSLFFCSGSEHVGNGESAWIPTMEQIDAASGRELRRLQRVAGGTYGHNLGYLADGRHVAPRNLGRSFFVLTTDAPSRHLPGSRSINHGGQGQNMLYEDGHVEFVLGCRLSDCVDHPFRNDDGFIEAGLSREDSVVAESATPPLVRP